MKPIPIMLVSDGVELPTGLARITRDLALGLSKMPEYRVATFGRGGTGSSQFPWQQYNYPVEHQWGENHLQNCWQNFAGTEHGIIFTVWDATRLMWLVETEGLSERLAKFVKSGVFQKWGYFPLDAVGPLDRISAMPNHVLKRYDKVVAYGIWAQGVMERSTGRKVDWIPHGINMDVFHRIPGNAGRRMIQVDDDAKLIGCLMTNQHRKDWGLAIRTLSNLVGRDSKFVMWAHSDVVRRHWDLDALVCDYGLQNNVRLTLTGEFDDSALAAVYSACDLTILPSLGEGFGYPIPESLACGVPVIHGNYGGGAELVRPEHKVEPVTYRIDTPWNVMRPVYEPDSWADKIVEVLESHNDPDELRASVEYLNWPNLWPVWERWFREALQ